MRKLRVGMVVNNLDVGGLEKVVTSLVSGFAFGDAVEPFVVCLDGPGRMFDALPIPASSTLVLNKRPRPLVRGVPYFRIDRDALRQLRAFARDNRLDVLHAHNLAPLLYAGLAVRGAARRPRVVYTEHNQIYRAGLGGRLKFLMYLRLADRIVACSGDLAGYLRHRLHVGRDVHVLYNGVDRPVPTRSRADVRSELGLGDDAFVFGAVASLTPQKELDSLLEAVARLPPRASHVHVVVVGEGPLRAALEDQARALRIPSRVRLLGYRADIADLATAFDGYVSSSRWEGLPLALLEALAMGKPIVATRVGGIPEIVDDGVNGYLVDAGDVDALARRMADVANDPAFCADAARRNVAKHASRFGLDGMLRAHAALYAEVARRA